MVAEAINIKKRCNFTGKVWLQKLPSSICGRWLCTALCTTGPSWSQLVSAHLVTPSQFPTSSTTLPALPKTSTSQWGYGTFSELCEEGMGTKRSRTSGDAGGCMWKSHGWRGTSCLWGSLWRTITRGEKTSKEEGTTERNHPNFTLLRCLKGLWW